MMDWINRINAGLDQVDSQLVGFEADELKDVYANMDLSELAATMHMLKKLNDHADEIKKKIGKVYDQIRTVEVPERMDEEGMQSMRVKDVGLVKLTTDMSVSVKDKDTLFQWLEEHGHDGLIQPQVNTQQLKSVLNARIKEGGDIPEDAVKVSPFTRASITK